MKLHLYNLARRVTSMSFVWLAVAIALPLVAVARPTPVTICTVVQSCCINVPCTHTMLDGSEHCSLELPATMQATTNGVRYEPPHRSSVPLGLQTFWAQPGLTGTLALLEEQIAHPNPLLQFHRLLI